MPSLRHHLLPLSIICWACSPASEPPVPPPAPVPVPRASAGTPSYAAVERELVHLVNVERMKNHLDTLKWNPALDKAAKIQAVEMAAERRMAHDLPGAEYPTLKDRIQHVGYGYRHLAENIAYGYPNAGIAVSAWMNSPGHRANILDRAVVETGVGVARAKSGELYYCQVFGARLY